MKLNFENTFANELKDFYASSKANNSPSPSLIKFNLELAKDLGSEWLKLDSDEGLSIFSGNTFPMVQGLFLRHIQDISLEVFLLYLVMVGLFC